jgi:hypothetical protein
LSRAKSTKKSRSIEEIAEILGIIEEKNLSKDWLLGELKKQKVKLKEFVSLNSFEILKKCNAKLIHKILNSLKEDLVIKDPKTMTKVLHWFFIDIVSSSDPKLPVKSQARKIYALNELIKRTETFKKENLEYLDIVPTGDGLAIGFPDSSEKPLQLAIELHKLLRKFNIKQKEKDKINIRIGIDSGPVYFMKGIKGEIFWGPGIIIAKRVMDLCGPNNIFASERIASDLRNLSEENKATMRSIGDYKIKHGQLTIYNIFSEEFGNKLIPKYDKILKPKEDDPFKKINFEFNTVEIGLEITNPKSMMVHHTWVWDIKNTSKIPLTSIYYGLLGDVPREFPKLNARVTDESGNKLEILSLDINKPLQKGFYVKLVKPIRKNQRGRIVKLEYDWPEPERNFEYAFASKTKKFKYFFRAPKDLELKHRILEAVRDSADRRRAEPPAEVKYLDDSTEIIWETPKNHKIRAHDVFVFQW